MLFGLNLEKAEKKLLKKIYKITGEGFESKVDGKSASLYKRLKYPDTKQEIFIAIMAYANKQMYCTVEVGKIQVTAEVLVLLNDLNNKLVGTMSFCIDQDKCLLVNAVYSNVSLFTIKKDVACFFGDLCSKNVSEGIKKLLPQLKPID